MKAKNKPAKKQDTIQLPDVSDIPGQEHIKPMPPGEMADTTASSAGEEGEGLFDEDNIVAGDSNISAAEEKLLASTDRPVTDETLDLQKLRLDNTDGRDPLNQQSDVMDMGEDLDVPGAELDDENEDIGEEDEENNAYSNDKQ